MEELLQSQAVRDLIALGIAVVSGVATMQVVNVAKAESETIKDEDDG